MKWALLLVAVRASAGTICDQVCNTTLAVNASCSTCVHCAVGNSTTSWKCIVAESAKCFGSTMQACPMGNRTAGPIGNVQSTDTIVQESERSPRIPPLALFFIVAGTLGTFLGIVTLYYRRKYYWKHTALTQYKEEPILSTDERKSDPMVGPLALDMARSPKYIPTFSMLQDEQSEASSRRNNKSHDGWGSIDTISSLNNDPWVFIRTEKADMNHVHDYFQTDSREIDHHESTQLTPNHGDNVSPFAAKPRTKDSFYI